MQERAYQAEARGRGVVRRHKERNKGSIRFYVQDRISMWRAKPGPPSDLTVDYLVALYEAQAGLCYFSGERMIFDGRAGKPLPNSLSLDRLDPALGYVQGNVAWCSYLVNTMKQNRTEGEFCRHMQQVLSHRAWTA